MDPPKELGVDVEDGHWFANSDVPAGVELKGNPPPPIIGLGSTGLLFPFSCMSRVGLSSILNSS